MNTRDISDNHEHTLPRPNSKKPEEATRAPVLSPSMQPRASGVKATHRARSKTYPPQSTARAPHMITTCRGHDVRSTERRTDYRRPPEGEQRPQYRQPPPSACPRPLPTTPTAARENTSAHEPTLRTRENTTRQLSQEIHRRRPAAWRRRGEGPECRAATQGGRDAPMKPVVSASFASNILSPSLQREGPRPGESKGRTPLNSPFIAGRATSAFPAASRPWRRP